MSRKTTIVIVTSDEDFIRRLSLNKNANTHIIDLDDNSSSTPTINDNSNLFDLAFLAQLSESSPNRDQEYKRALDTPQTTEAKVVKVSKKATNLTCVVCNDYAIGFNYDALTCASCKTFFHRTARQPPETIRCLDGQRKCSVSHATRRKCQQCRLERCFAMGMREDYFHSEEEKQRRRKYPEKKFHLSAEPLPASELAPPRSAPLVPSPTECFPQIPDEIDLNSKLEKVENE